MKFEESCQSVPFFFMKFVEWGHGPDAQQSRKSVDIYVEKYQPGAMVSIIGSQYVHKRKKWAEVEKLRFCQGTPFVWLPYFFLVVRMECGDRRKYRGQKVKNQKMGHKENLCFILLSRSLSKSSSGQSLGNFPSSKAKSWVLLSSSDIKYIIF